MIKKKKKLKKSTKVKFGSVSIKNVKSFKKDDEDRKAGKGKKRKEFFKARIGRQMIYILPPTSDKMDGRPFVTRFIHNNIGPENKFAQCCRLSMDSKTRSDCPQCLLVSKQYDEARALEKKGKDKLAEKVKNEASSKSAKPRQLLQILDVSGVYNMKNGKIEGEFPKCFGDNLGSEDENKYKKCRTCPVLDSCKKGIQLWEIQYTPYQAMMEKLAEDEVDITNPKNALPMKLKRTGEGLKGTKYIAGWDVQPLVIPDHVIAFMEKNASDLTTLIKPSTEEEMLAMMSGESKPSDDGKDSKSTKKVAGKVVKPRISEREKSEMRRRLKSMSDKRKAEAEA